MSTLVRLRRASLAMLAPIAIASALVVGCGESGPPPMSKEGLEAAKQDRETIIRKEYGQRAFDKAAAKKSSAPASKPGP